METWIFYQTNPCKKSVGDCAVRAISKALNVDWKRAYIILCSKGLELCNLPNADEVWGAVLRDYGFVRRSIPGDLPDDYNAADFCIDHMDDGKIYVLGFGGHVACVVDGYLYDSWNSSREIPQFYWEMRD